MALENLDAAILEWTSCKEWLTKAKEREMELRNDLAAHFFQKKANGAFPEGTNKFQDDRFKVKLVAKMNRTVLEEMEAATLAEAALTAEEGAGLIKRKPELSLTVYNKLPPAKRLIVDRMLLEKPGAVELEISNA